MKVRAIWEFEVDTDDFDPKFVNVRGLAEDLTKAEVANLLAKNELAADDFSYEVEDKLNEVSFEIEHYNGDTYLAFMAKIQDDGNIDVVQTSNCSHADTDGDYIFDTNNNLIRIQADKPINADVYNEIWNCYHENEEKSNMIWTLFVLDFDGTYSCEAEDGLGVRPSVYLVPENRLEKVQQIAYEAGHRFNYNNEYGLDCIGDYFEGFMDMNEIPYQEVGSIYLTFGKRQVNYLADYIPRVIV